MKKPANSGRAKDNSRQSSFTLRVPTLQELARALCGEIAGHEVLAPGPGHSAKDRSLSVKPSPDAPCGFVCHSFANDDPIVCRYYVRQRLGLPRFKTSRAQHVKPHPVEPPCIEYAMRIWREAVPIRGSLAQKYLANRRVESGENRDHMLRFHASCAFGQERFPALVALIRNIKTNEPQGVQRTALNGEGTAIKRNGKTLRMTLGLMTAGAIKIDDGADVIYGLAIGEGLETTLSGRAYGYRPAWAVLSDTGIRDFPILSGIDALTIFLENDANGANARTARECIERWGKARAAKFSHCGRTRAMI
jgi:putative DNA primase/helicase